MSEARIVLVVFGVLAVLLIAGPVVTVMTKTVPGDAGLDGDVSRAFLSSDGVDAATKTNSAVATILPKGTPQKTVFDAFAASSFTCATESNAATCYRTRMTAGCEEDWKVRVIFKDDGTVWSSQADRTANCR